MPKQISLLIILLVLTAIPVFAQTDTFDLDKIREDRKAPVEVPKFDSSPLIDGKLDDSQWQQAAKFTNFVQTEPGDLIAPSRKTIAYMGYDDKHLYIAFMCFDEPDKITYSVAKRDSVGSEDYVGVFLDTFNDQRRAYILQFNPLGIQADGVKLEGERRSDFSVDLVMESKGLVIPEGYSIEVKIPFKSLRYEAGEGKFWGIDFWRRIDRFNREIAGWMPIERGVSELQQLGRITGLKGINTERTLEIVPSITLSKSSERVEDLTQPGNSRLDGLPFGTDLGVSVKYQITPNVTLDAAINPDFAEVEADAPVVRANQRFPIFFPEKRPFFLERIDIFRSRSQVVNTRNIADPDVAAKLTGKIGKNTFGILGAVDNFEEDDLKAYAAILRLRRDIGANSNIGMFATTYHRGSDTHNSLFGFDGKYQIDPRTVFSFEAFGSHSRKYYYNPDIDDSEYRTGNGVAYRAEYDYTGRNRGWSLNVEGRSHDYRADLGFTRRTNTHGTRFGYRLQTEPAPNASLIRFTHRGFMSGDIDEKGRILRTSYGAFNSFDFQNQLSFRVFLRAGLERLYEEEFGARRNQLLAGAFSGLPVRDAFQYGGEIDISKNFGNRIRLNAEFGYDENAFDFDFGASEKFPRVSPVYLQYLIDRMTNPNLEEPPIDPGKGRLLRMELNVEVQPTDPLNIRLSYDRRRLTRKDNDLTAFDSNIYSLRTTYQFTRFVSTRARFDYNNIDGGFDTQLLFGWTPSPGTAFFVGYNDTSSYKGYNPYTETFDPGFRRDSNTFFIRLSYLFRKSF
ncbi:MAG: carbohydrate binding family 9 domain-containing protein [Pyrinomonadaceae bacterium]|nr:carbohydrate binding family 9 domain-containing protein [Pyrinomonadaceae bacterium]